MRGPHTLFARTVSFLHPKLHPWGAVFAGPLLVICVGLAAATSVEVRRLRAMHSLANREGIHLLTLRYNTNLWYREPVQMLWFDGEIIDRATVRDAVMLPLVQCTLFSECQFEADVVDELATFCDCPQVTFRDCRIDLRRAIEGLSETTRIRHLIITECVIEAHDLNAVYKIRNLQRLTLKSCSIGPAGLRGIGKAWKLKQLVLTDSNFTDQDLLELDGCYELEWLDLSGGAVSDEGVSVLNRLPRLKRLALCRTCVSNECFDQLSTHSNLETVYTWGSQVRVSREVVKLANGCVIR